MDLPAGGSHPQVRDNGLAKGDPMGFFPRKASRDEDAERCPRCRERLPDGAVECMMCGAALEPLRGTPRTDEAKASSAKSRDVPHKAT
jgi:hypothetical protein